MIAATDPRVRLLGSQARGQLRTVFAMWVVVALGAMQVAVLPVLAQESERARRLGQKMLCVCGHCNQILTACNHVGCAYSHDMLRELDQRVARNEPDDLTLQSFVQQYGPTVLAEPPAKGFNRAAWVMPVVVPLVGLGLVWLVVSRWRKRAMLAPGGVSSEMLARARKETGGELDD